MLRQPAAFFPSQIQNLPVTVTLVRRQHPAARESNNYQQPLSESSSLPFRVWSRLVPRRQVSGTTHHPRTFEDYSPQTHPGRRSMDGCMPMMTPMAHGWAHVPHFSRLITLVGTLLERSTWLYRTTLQLYQGVQSVYASPLHREGVRFFRVPLFKLPPVRPTSMLPPLRKDASGLSPSCSTGC